MTITLARGTATRGKVARQMAGVDAIEIKVTVPDHQVDEALHRYGLTVDNDEERYVYFFDTPELALFERGLIARARRTVGDAHDSTVKFRPAVPGEIPTRWRAIPGFKLEADASETGAVKSASLTMPVAKGLINQVVAGRRAIAKLFTRRQEKFLGALAGDGIEFDDLRVLGPLRANRWKFADPACPWPMTAELWKRADGARLMELSIKAPVVQAAVAIAGFMAHLAEIGAERDLAQQTKTRWALEFHADRIRASRSRA
jgi:hypothetical protein